MIGSLFSGIGGLELGLERAGLGPVVWQVEQDAFCRAVLAKHWPGVDRSISDVRNVAASALPRPQLLCGGFPCQDVSGAGKGAGLAGERSGLWFVFRDVVEAFRPSGVVVENVASGKSRWLCQVRSDLHALGYRTRAVQISAANVGAPHLRERVFVLALADAGRLGHERSTDAGADRVESREARGRILATAGSGALGDSGGQGLAGRAGERSNYGPKLPPAKRAGGEPMADANGMRQLQSQRGEPEQRRRACDDREMGDPARLGFGQGAGTRAERSRFAESASPSGGEAESGVGRVPHGLSAGLDGHRWPAPRGADPFPWEPPRTIQGKQEHRRARLKALGNAVVPQCALVAGLTLRAWIAEEAQAA